MESRLYIGLMAWLAVCIGRKSELARKRNRTIRHDECSCNFRVAATRPVPTLFWAVTWG